MQHPTRIGKYQIDQYLGGGMSHVYRATDSILGRRVAVKMLTETAVKEAEAKARFLQEARLASNISHDNIIAVYDFGEENGLPFMVMEYLEGESLRQALDNHRAGDLRRKLEIGLYLGRALDHIHSKQIVHRDIKPENINIDVSGRVKLMDFGIAKAQNMKLTRAGFTLGTPYYMAPEQVMGQEVTPQTDIYSFGVLLYEMLAGAKPFLGEGYEKIFQQTLYEQPNEAPLKSANVPQPVIQLVMRLLAKQPAQRPAGFGAVCSEIEGLLARLVPVKPNPKTATPSKISGAPSLNPPASPNLPPTMPMPLSGQRAGQTSAGAAPTGFAPQNPPPQVQPAQGLPHSHSGQTAPVSGGGGLASLPPAALMAISAVVVLLLVGVVFFIIARFV